MFKLGQAIGQVFATENGGMVAVIPLNHMLPKTHFAPIENKALTEIADKIGEKVMLEVEQNAPKRMGRVPNPESTMRKVLDYCNKLAGLGQDYTSIRAQVEKTFAGEKPAKTITQYFYVWRAAQKKAA
jgi:hypothetical protein